MGSSAQLDLVLMLNRPWVNNLVGAVKCCPIIGTWVVQKWIPENRSYDRLWMNRNTIGNYSTYWIFAMPSQFDQFYNFNKLAVYWCVTNQQAHGPRKQRYWTANGALPAEESGPRRVPPREQLDHWNYARGWNTNGCITIIQTTKGSQYGGNENIINSILRYLKESSTVQQKKFPEN